MANPHRWLPEDLTQLLGLIQSGQLFAIQEWIKAGKHIRLEEGPGSKLSPLHEAIQTGFHSMVEELLRPGSWTQEELAEPLDLARSRKRFDIAGPPFRNWLAATRLSRTSST